MSASREFKVGAFVLAGLIVAGFVVFLIGDERQLFSSKLLYHTSFHDVQGLKPGAPIRMGGVDIGTVSNVGHGPNPNDDRLYVDLLIVRSELGRIREGTVARVANKGLLGDKMIELEAGPATNPALPPGGTIRGEESEDAAKLFSEVGGMAEKAQRILENLETGTRGLADERLQEDLRASVHSVRVLLHQAAEGDGYLHRIISDREEAERLSHTVASLQSASQGLEQITSEVRKLLARINEGPGFAHELVYGERGADALASFGAAAGQAALTLKEVREGNGVAHAFLFGAPGASGTKAAENLTSMTDDLRQITADLRAGKGTLGALLVDPSVYDDVKRVLGDVERNDALRAMVRYSIKQDEKRPNAGVRSGRDAGTSDVKPNAP